MSLLIRVSADSSSSMESPAPVMALVVLMEEGEEGGGSGVRSSSVLEKLLNLCIAEEKEKKHTHKGSFLVLCQRENKLGIGES